MKSAYKRWKVSSTALRDGVPLSIVAQVIASGRVKEREVLPPELCVNPKLSFKETSKLGLRPYYLSLIHI